MSAELVRARIDDGPVVPLMWLVILLGFLLNLADGIDVVAMSVTAPSVAKAWGLERAMLGPLFSSALTPCLGDVFGWPEYDRRSLDCAH